MRPVTASSRLHAFPGPSDTSGVHAPQNIGGVPQEPREPHGALEIAPADDIDGLGLIWGLATDDKADAPGPLLLMAFVAFVPSPRCSVRPVVGDEGLHRGYGKSGVRPCIAALGSDFAGAAVWIAVVRAGNATKVSYHEWTVRRT
jgi:hypothetical protein